MYPALVLLHIPLVFSYSAYSTTKAYDLQVPGSTPIRIIEADPVWDFVDIHDQSITGRHNSDLEHRTLRTVQKQQQLSSTTQNTRTTLGNPINSQDDTDYDDLDESANSSRLKDFLEKYSVNKIKTKLEDQDYGHHQQQDSLLENVEIVTKNPSPDIRGDKSKAWNLNSPYQASDSFDQKKGWVSLEAVPWSVSKISKWHTNNVKPSGFNDKVWNVDDYTYSPKPNVVTRPNGYNYDHQYQHQQESYRPPNLTKPTAVYAQKVHLEYTTNRNDNNKLWGSNSNNYLRPIYSEYHHQHTDDCNHKNNRYANSYSDVITDGQPANFPETQQQESTYNRRRGTSEMSHPFNGDGEWVLLSTTKGYKYPHRHNRERALHFNSALNSPDDTNIVDTHKSVKLTVLPPAKGSRVNMTTSHGGLLQVESTFQTVDQAQKAFVKRQKIKQQKNKKRRPMIHKRKVLPMNDDDDFHQKSDSIATANLYRPNRSLDRPDASTVLAAVGAGLVPATMALMMPMALNGKRRRRRRDLYGRIEDGFPPVGQMMFGLNELLAQN